MDLICVFSPPTNFSIVNNSGYGEDGGELNEDDVFCTGEPRTRLDRRLLPLNIRKQKDKFGILAALSDEPKAAKKNVLAIPKQPSRKEELAKPAPKSNFSAPVNMPVLSKEMMKANAILRNKAFFAVHVHDDDDNDDNEWLPPHEIVARGSATLTPNVTFSMLEGARRNMKGRDLRQVRNEMFKQTGFLD
ncbi:hypothetical protein QQ045_003553 [Rhodiola kirilowii]